MNRHRTLDSCLAHDLFGKPLQSLEALRAGACKLPGTIFRAKGVIYSSDAPERRVVLQGVGRRVDSSMEEQWGEPTPRTQIVAIGAADGVDTPLLDEAFAACISTEARLPQCGRSRS